MTVEKIAEIIAEGEGKEGWLNKEEKLAYMEIAKKVIGELCGHCDTPLLREGERYLSEEINELQV